MKVRKGVVALYLTLVVFAVAVWSGQVPVIAGPDNGSVPVPTLRCQEDEVIVGVGQFEAGRWTRYECTNREEVS